MSLDIWLTNPGTDEEVYSANITHNLTTVASEAGIYGCLWRPEENEITKAEHLIEPLENGLSLLKLLPDHYRSFDSPNGWGTYDDFVPWLENLLEACITYPGADVNTNR